MTTINLTINGKAYGPFEVRNEMSMIDFLREYLGLTGTKFGCGVAQCLSCAVIVDNPDGTSQTSPTPPESNRTAMPRSTGTSSPVKGRA